MPESLFAYNFIKKRDSCTAFSCESLKILKNTFFYRTSLVATSALEEDFDNFKRFIIDESNVHFDRDKTPRMVF